MRDLVRLDLGCAVLVSISSLHIETKTKNDLYF